MKMILNKTPYKGLYLTENGKAWHKTSKCEIKPTKSGKIRFNGKLYDLQKLIYWSGKNVAKMKTNAPKPVLKKVVSISELQKQGFKKTKISGLYVSNNGLCYNSISKRNLSIRNGKTTINGKAYNVAKIILETFCKIPIRAGQINFKNGNAKDFSFENLEYCSTVKQPPPVPTDLIKCIRLYFEVPKNTNTKSLLFKYYLYEIAKKRGFLWRCETSKDFDLFLNWLQTDYTNESKSIYNLSLKFGFTATNGKNAINKYLNLLINECLQDFENGLLQIKDFAQKPPTKTQKFKQLQKSVYDYGLNVKIPLRKPSVKETINKYLKQTKI